MQPMGESDHIAMSEPFTAVATRVVDMLPYTIGFVLWTVLCLSAGQRLHSSSTTQNSVGYSEPDRIYESQITILQEPGEFYGVGLMDVADLVKLVRLRKDDGKYYEVDSFSVYDDEVESVADALSVLGVERARETTERKGLSTVGDGNA
jgi:hypothetical protein